MNNSIFVGSLYLAIAVAAAVVVSSVLLEVSMATMMVRTALAFATFTCLGWSMAFVLNHAVDAGESREAQEVVEERASRGAMVDVVLPATDDENS